MTFSVLTILLITIDTLAVTIGIRRGKKKTAAQAGMQFGILLCSIAVAIFISPWITELTLTLPLKYLADKILIRGTFTTFPRFKTITASLMKALAAPVVFALIFPVVYYLLSGIIKLFVRYRGKRGNKNTANTIKVKETHTDNPWGALFGGITAFAICVALFAPIMGTVRIADRALHTLTNQDSIRIGKISSNNLESLDTFSQDTVMSFMYVCGGQFIYESCARAKLYDESFYVVKEFDASEAILPTIIENFPALVTGDNLTHEQIRKIKEYIALLKSSTIGKAILADYIAMQSEQWLSELNETTDASYHLTRPIEKAILEVLKNETPQTICDDVNSFINIMEIIEENHIAGDDYAAIVDILNDESVLDRINTEIQKNPNFPSITSSLQQVASDSYLMAVRECGIRQPDVTDAFVIDIADTFTRSVGYSDERRVNAVRDCLSDFATLWGMCPDDNTLDAASYTFMTEFGDLETVSSEDVRQFIWYTDEEMTDKS